MRTNTCIWVSPGDRSRLERLVLDRNTPQKHVWRARIVLLSRDGLGTMEIMRRVGKSKPTVWRWQQRYLAAGVDGLSRDRPRGRGRAGLGRRGDIAGGGEDAGRQAAEGDPLEPSHDGQGGGHRPQQRAADLGQTGTPFAAAPSKASPNWRRPSTTTLPNTTRQPNPSSGPPPAKTFSKKSIALARP